MGKTPKIPPQKGLVVIIDLITTKVIEFQNFAEPGAD
jgi:hypothetical protein